MCTYPSLMHTTPAAMAVDGKTVNSSLEFMMFAYKIVACDKRYSHDWSLCPFSHRGEKAKRRDPRMYPYQSKACPNSKRGDVCPAGDNCPYAHQLFEYWLHPTRYRTSLCRNGPGCSQRLCFFAHSQEELRDPEKAALEWQVKQQRLAVAAAEQALQIAGLQQAPTPTWVVRPDVGGMPQQELLLAQAQAPPLQQQEQQLLLLQAQQQQQQGVFVQQMGVMGGVQLQRPQVLVQPLLRQRQQLTPEIEQAAAVAIARGMIRPPPPTTAAMVLQPGQQEQAAAAAAVAAQQAQQAQQQLLLMQQQQILMTPGPSGSWNVLCEDPSGAAGPSSLPATTYALPIQMQHTGWQAAAGSMMMPTAASKPLQLGTVVAGAVAAAIPQQGVLPAAAGMACTVSGAMVRPAAAAGPSAHWHIIGPDHDQHQQQQLAAVQALHTGFSSDTAAAAAAGAYSGMGQVLRRTSTATGASGSSSAPANIALGPSGAPGGGSPSPEGAGNISSLAALMRSLTFTASKRPSGPHANPGDAN